MEEIKIFNSPQFGEIRTIEIGGQPYFVGIDVANALGYSKVREAISTHVDEDDSVKQGVTDSLGRVQQTTLINESGMYSLIFGSKLPSAKTFKKWVTSEVLPSIRKTGSYSANQLSPIEMQLEMMKSMQLQLQELIETKAEIKQLKSEVEEIKQRTTTDLHQSTIVAFVSRNHIKLDVTKYGAMGRKATSICKKRGLNITKINDVRWGKVSVYPDSVLEEVFKINN